VSELSAAFSMDARPAVVRARADMSLSREVPVILYAADEWGGVGGTANYILMIARGLRRRGYRVAAICQPVAAMAGVRDELARMGVDVRTLDGDVRGSPAARLRQLAWYMRLFREYRGAILALMMGYHTRGGAAIFAARLSGIGGIVRADLTPPEPPIGWREKAALRSKDLLLDRVVVGALENIDAFARDMGRSTERMAVIHTGIELDRFHPGRDRCATREALGYSAGDVVIGTMSRLDDSRKGVNFLLDAAARVAPAFPKTRFLVVGEGLWRPRLEAHAEALGIRDRVHFTGWRSDIPQLLAAMDVFVMASLFEGGPTTVLEAMAMAKPVVATHVGMVPEVIDDGCTGLVVPPADAPAIAEALKRILDDPMLGEQLGHRARAHAERDFTIDLMVERYLTVFAEAKR
jgi:glycosyltransferase involved in cell wall biosynthesis